ncbi:MULTISPECIES: hypothetical protein [unclassified Mesorhizobium]|uniref:hypothetical protein n=1 Tax=unclassified Mesorhizobium TaxID=325217 RepID=UPI0012289DB7|nr:MULTISPECIES: hypothetical protein [unclassified Mesorhizobium]MDG4887971.1 hypothetical protein [Mesorhizobium sp. WSM4887]TIQ07562.1 MAG: hypothetical protein E5X50_14380 [Mesorhizobium sp.]TJW07365.1 MAG: hypothetical protein E5X42_28220 [Mesorhizobium sp.]
MSLTSATALPSRPMTYGQSRLLSFAFASEDQCGRELRSLIRIEFGSVGARQAESIKTGFEVIGLEQVATEVSSRMFVVGEGGPRWRISPQSAAIPTARYEMSPYTLPLFNEP